MMATFLQEIIEEQIDTEITNATGMSCVELSKYNRSPEMAADEGAGSEALSVLCGAPGKHRVSTPISRARVICPRASFVPENLWEEIPRARHLVNNARICGTNFWRDMTRAS